MIIALELLKMAVVLGALLGSVHVLVYLERKLSAGIQGRVGPTKVNLPLLGRIAPGFAQPLADAIKMIFKEDVIPARAEKFIYTIAPMFVAIPPVLAFAVIPFGNKLQIGGHKMNLQIADLDIGILVAIAVLGMAVFGLSFGGWASNSKYSLLGGLRSSSQLIAYELSLGLIVVAVVAFMGTLNPQKIVENQLGGRWNIFFMPLGALVFYIAALAENNRAPFDLAEAEPELIGGYHTEYSSMKFAMFFMGEYIAIVTMSALFTTLFLGGWDLFGLIRADDASLPAAILSLAVFGGKTFSLILVYMWIRWTVPRFKYTRLMHFGWKFLLPLSLAHVLLYSLIPVVVPWFERR